MTARHPFVIPADRLPPGFAERVDAPPDPPVLPRLAATVVLLRDPPAGGPPDQDMALEAGQSHGGSGRTAPEVLLLRRHHASGFVPGAYVFPGGCLDEADSAPALLERATALGSEPDPPAAFWLAAVREVFEETGVLLAVDAAGRMAPDAASEPRMAHWRERLLSERADLAGVLEAEGLVPAFGEMVCCGHWVTPVAEPRRFDTRFFVAGLPPGRRAVPDVREMTDAVWLAPAEALKRFEEGSLPMVFPTVRTLESLMGFQNVESALAAFRGRSIEPILPRLVRTAGGVGIIVDQGRP